MYISSKLIAKIEDDASLKDTQFLSIIKNVNNEYSDNNYEQCLIQLRRLIENVNGVFNTNKLSEIISSEVWNKSAHSDYTYYTDMLSAVDNGIGKQFDSFIEDDSRSQRELLGVINATNLYPNNYLHSTDRTHHLVIDDEMLPPKNQINLLVNIGYIGIKNKEIYVEPSQWKKGISSSEYSVSGDSEGLIVKLFSDDPLSESEDIALHLAKAMCVGDYEAAYSIVDQELQDGGLENRDLNKWIQLKLCSGIILYFQGKKQSYRDRFEQVYHKSRYDLPHIASATAQLAKIIGLNDDPGDDDYFEKWDGRAALMGGVNFPRAIYPKSEETINRAFKSIVDKDAGTLTLGGSNIPILRNTADDAARCIVECCTYGLLHHIPNLISLIFKACKIQLSETPEYRDEVFGLYALFFLKTQKVKGIRDDVYQAALADVTKEFVLDDDKKTVIKSVVESLNQAINNHKIKAIGDYCGVLSDDEVSDCIAKIKTVFYLEKNARSSLASVAEALNTWLLLLSVSNAEITKRDVSEVVKASNETWLYTGDRTRIGLNRLTEKVKHSDQEVKKVFEKYLKELIEDENRYDLMYVKSYLDITNDYDYASKYTTHMHMLALVGVDNYCASFSDDIALLLEDFSKSINEILDSGQGEADDDFSINFFTYSYLVLKVMEKSNAEDHDIYERIAKIINSTPAKMHPFRGSEHIYFLTKLYLLLASDLEEETKNNIVKRVADIVEADYRLEDRIPWAFSNLDSYKYIISYLKIILSNQFQESASGASVLRSLFRLDFNFPLQIFILTLEHVYKTLDENSQFLMRAFMRRLMRKDSLNNPSMIAAQYGRIVSAFPIAKEEFDEEADMFGSETLKHMREVNS